MFPAQMETRGPHVASVVFPRRSGAKAGRPDFQTLRQSSRPEPPSLPLPRASASLFPVALAQSLTFVSANLAHPASPQPLPTGFGQGPEFSGFGLPWLSSGVQAALGLQDPGTGLRIVQRESVVEEDTRAKARLPKFKPKLCLLQAVWPQARTYLSLPHRPLCKMGLTTAPSS